jgi:hypothetical protein
MDEDGNLIIVDSRPVLVIHVAELRKPVGWKEKRGVSKICYGSADRNEFELILRMMHLEILLANPDHPQSLRDVLCSPESLNCGKLQIWVLHGMDWPSSSTPFAWSILCPLTAVKSCYIFNKM